MIFLRNLLRAKARSLMTVLGLAGGIGLCVAIYAIGDDLNRQIESVAGSYSLEVVIQERHAPSPLTSRISAAQMSALQQRFGNALSPMVVGTLSEKWSAYALVIGATPAFMQQIPLVAGAHLSGAGGEMLLGEIASQNLALQPGQVVTIGGRERRIRGIYRTGSRLLDGGLMTSVAEAQELLSHGSGERVYTLGLLRAADRDAAARMIGSLSRDFPNLKAISGSEFAGSLRMLRVVKAFVTTISAVALIGTLLVVSNTLVMAIAERTREIGILMTIGWTPWLILRMLLAESLTLCGIGAALGNLFALLLLRVLNGIESIGFGWIPVRFPWSLVAQSFALSLAVAIVALGWPALIVSRTQPLAALRHE